MSQTRTTSPPRTVARRAYLILTLTLLAIIAWMVAERVPDDRGSDSSEKALMIILGIGIAGVVSAAAYLWINGHTNF